MERWKLNNTSCEKIWVFQLIINKSEANHKTDFTDVSKLSL